MFSTPLKYIDSPEEYAEALKLAISNASDEISAGLAFDLRLVIGIPDNKIFERITNFVSETNENIPKSIQDLVDANPPLISLNEDGSNVYLDEDTLSNFQNSPSQKEKLSFGEITEMIKDNSEKSGIKIPIMLTGILRILEGQENQEMIDRVYNDSEADLPESEE